MCGIITLKVVKFCRLIFKFIIICKSCYLLIYRTPGQTKLRLPKRLFKRLFLHLNVYNFFFLQIWNFYKTFINFFSISIKILFCNTIFKCENLNNKRLKIKIKRLRCENKRINSHLKRLNKRLGKRNFVCPGMRY
jgi:hypothetical protein